jgi:hypothetical protein
LSLAGARRKGKEVGYIVHAISYQYQQDCLCLWLRVRDYSQLTPVRVFEPAQQKSRGHDGGGGRSPQYPILAP